MWTDFWTHGWMPWMFFGPVMMLIFVAVCGAAAYFAFRSAGGAGRAIEILRERFARGEINQAEFEERRRLLLG